MQEKILETIEKYKATGDLFYKKGTSTHLNFENNEFKTVEEKEIQGYALRLINEDAKEGYSFSTTGDIKIIENALNLCEYGEKVYYSFPKKTELPQDIPIYYSETIKQFNIKEMIELGQETLNVLKKENSHFNYSLSMGCNDSTQSISNTNGFDYHYKESSFYASLSAFNAVDGEIIEIGDFLTNRALVKDFSSLIQSIRDTMTLLALPKQNIQHNRYPVIFSPKALRVFISILLTAFNGKNIEKGISPLNHKIGAKIGSSSFSIYNDGIHPDLFSSAAFDDEGIPSGSFPIIKNGVCFDGIYDLKTAQKLAKKPTSNGLRGITSPVEIGFRNIIVSPGEFHSDSLMKNMGNGIYIDELIGGGMSNSLAGELSANIGFGYKIENRTITGQIKNAMINGNVWEMLQKIAAVSKNTKIFGTSICPYVLFNDIEIVI